VATIDTETLGEAIVTLSAHIHVANHRLLVLLAEFDRRGGWKPAGHRSCAHWLAFRTGIGLGAARERMRAARALHKLPQTSAAMARGELSFSKVRALTRVADDLESPEEEARLVEFARECTAAQLETLIRGWKTVSRKDEVELERERHRSRFLSVCPAEDGMYRVRGRLDPEVGALLMRAIEAAGDALFRSSRDWAPEGGTRGPATREITPRQRRADAVGLLVEQAMRLGFGGTRSGGVDDGPAEAENVSAETCREADQAGPAETKDACAEASEGPEKAGADGAENVSAETSSGAGRCDNGSRPANGEANIPGPAAAPRAPRRSPAPVPSATRSSCTWTSPRFGPMGSLTGPTSPTAPAFPRKRRGDSAAMPGSCAPPGVTGVKSWMWGAGPGACLRRCAGPWRSGTGGAASQGAGSGSPRPTTSSTGPTAVRPGSRTSCSSAASITGRSTRRASA
jgi:hypothetical protein